MVLSTMAAGTISQMARGPLSFLTKSAREEAPTAPSRTSSSTAFGETSNTAQSCPPTNRRRTIFAPILPRPIIPSCIKSSFYSLLFAFRGSLGEHTQLISKLPIAANQPVSRTIMMEFWFRLRFEFRDDALGQYFPKFNAPLVKSVYIPDRTLSEDAMFI